MTQQAGIALAAAAYTTLSLGLVLMKKGVGWIGRGKPRGRAWNRDLAVWTAGFILANLYIVPAAMALKILESHIVGAMAGWGVIVLIVLSHVVLKEKLRPADAGPAALVAGAIVALNVFETRNRVLSPRTALYAVAAVLPYVILGAGLARRFKPRPWAVLLAAASGISTGMIVVTMKILVSSFGFRVADYFGSAYFYVYLLFSLTAFLSLQVAYKAGPMLVVGPVQYSASILYPILCAWPVFGILLRPIQAAAAGALLLGVYSLLRRP